MKRRPLGSPATVAATALADPHDEIGFPPMLQLGPKTAFPPVFGLPTAAGNELVGRTPPDMHLETSELAWAAVRAASLRGDAKRYAGLPRQDSLGLLRVGSQRSPALCVVVADGVGSSAQSHHGSAEACARAVKHVGDADDPREAGGAALIDEVRSHLLTVAADLGTDPKALSTTLVVAYLSPVDGGGAEGWVTCVGDSGYTVVGDTGELAAPSDELLHDTTTAALPTAVGEIRHRELVLSGNQTLLLWTDGFEPMLQLPGVRHHFEQVFASPPPAPAEFLWHLDTRLKSYDDDRTVAAVWVR